MKIWYSIVVAIALLATVGCTKESTPTPTGAGRLVVALQAGEGARDAVPGDGVAADGGGMVDVALVLIDPLGTVVARQTFTDLTGDEQLRKTVEFADLNIGNYTLYAYANTQTGSALAADANTSQNTDDTFTPLTGTAVPEVDGVTSMLLTAQRQIPIGVGTTEATIDLLRPVVSFSFELHNHSNQPLRVTELAFSDFNSSTGYILPHDGALPTSNHYRALPAFEGPQTVTVKEPTDPASGWKELYHTYLFENRASAYTFDMAFEVSEQTTTTADVLGTTAVTSPAEDTRYVIRQQGQTRYVALNTNNAPTTVTSPLGDTSAYWYFVANDSGYRLQNLASGYYLRYNNGLTSTNNAGSATTFTYSNSRLSFTSNRRTYYLRYNNGFTTTTSSNSATSWQLYAVETETSTTEQTQRYTVRERQLLVVDRATAAVTPMTEQLRNQQIRVVVNAYINDTNGAFRFEVVPWEEKSAEIVFGKQ